MKGLAAAAGGGAAVRGGALGGSGVGRLQLLRCYEVLLEGCLL